MIEMQRVKGLFHLQRVFLFKVKSPNLTDNCFVKFYRPESHPFHPQKYLPASSFHKPCRAHVGIQQAWGCAQERKANAGFAINGMIVDAKRTLYIQAVLHAKEKENEKAKDASEEIFEDQARQTAPKKENILTVPNILTMSRIVATPWLGYLVVHDQFSLALGVFVVAGFTDMLDGYIARNFKNQQTVCGSFLDPLADKFLVSVLTISLTVAGLIPVPLTSLIVFRDLLLVIVAFYIRYLSIPPPKTLARYFDATFATATLHPSILSKINTILQMSLVAASIAAPVFGYVDHILLKSLWWITGGTTLGSGIQYAVQRNQYFNILHRKMKRRI